MRSPTWSVSIASKARPSGLQAALLAHKERQEEEVAGGGTSPVGREAGGDTGGSSTELELRLCFFAGGWAAGEGRGMPGGAGRRAPGGTWARIIVSKACAWAGSSRLAGCKPGGRRPWRKAAGKAAESLRLASAKEVAGGKRNGGNGKGEPAWKSGESEAAANLVKEYSHLGERQTGRFGL